jgi:hypothetical protein
MRASHVLVGLVLAIATPLAAQTSSLTSRSRHQSLFHVVGYLAGGLVVGAWAGYVASQVNRSDWSEPTGRGAERVRFSVAGAAFGLLSGAFLGTRGSRPAAIPQPPRLSPPLDGPITSEQIRSSSARTISELVRELRPHWLRARGPEVITILDANTGVHAANGVVVYLNGTPYGDLASLDEVPIEEVTSIRFLNGPAAVLRYGTGNEDGAILLSTAIGP